MDVYIVGMRRAFYNAPKFNCPGGPVAILLALGLGMAASGPALAGQSPWAGPEVARVRLVSAGVPAGTPTGAAPSPPSAAVAFWGGLEFRMKPGWKIYWRSPGTAGRPPRADWSSSRGIVAGPFLWPRPRLFRFAGIETVGYKGRATLPVRLTPAGLGPAPLPTGMPGRRTLAVDLAYQTCKHICIPVRLRLGLSGAALDRPDPEVAARLASARAARPARLPSPRVRRLPDGRLRIFLASVPGAAWRSPRLIVEAGPKTRIGFRPTAIDGARAVFEFAPPARRGRFRLLVLDGSRSGVSVLDLP